jgi:hypothetical protein
MDAFEYFHKYILRQFFRIFPVSRQPDEECMNRAAVPVQKGGKAGQVSRLCHPDVICVGILLHCIFLDAPFAGRLQPADAKVV